jgi:putative transcriptional regulator
MNYLLKNRLGECRAARGMKKSQLAFRLKMSRAYVTRLERGDIRPSLETAVRIARMFGKPVEEVFQLVEEDGKARAEAAPKAPSANGAGWLRSGASAAGFQNHFPDASPPASEKQRHGGERHSLKY